MNSKKKFTSPVAAGATGKHTRTLTATPVGIRIETNAILSQKKKTNENRQTGRPLKREKSITVQS